MVASVHQGCAKTSLAQKLLIRKPKMPSLQLTRDIISFKQMANLLV
jgi:hypothetical protein